MENRRETGRRKVGRGEKKYVKTKTPPSHARAYARGSRPAWVEHGCKTSESRATALSPVCRIVHENETSSKSGSMHLRHLMHSGPHRTVVLCQKPIHELDCVTSSRSKATKSYRLISEMKSDSSKQAHAHHSFQTLTARVLHATGPDNPHLTACQ